MTEKTLIIGFGRAGQRHAKELKTRNIDFAVVEPAAVQSPPGRERYSQLNQVPWRDFTSAIIATPPTLHPEQIFACLSNGLPLLCEKPLCDIGQLGLLDDLLDDDPVMVAYNYRYHTALKAALAGGENPHSLYCYQYRDNLPDWGLLLDHCSHDLDIARMFGRTEVKRSCYTKTATLESWHINLEGFDIIETIFWHGNPLRIANLYSGNGTIEITPDRQMHRTMYDLFYMRYFGDSLEQALVTQHMLEAAFEKAE